jgi:hypothetical protein
MPLQVNGAFVVIMRSGGPAVYLARGDSAAIARLDSDWPGLVEDIRYDTHSFGGEAIRNAYMRAKRLKVWGEGAIRFGTLTLHCDGVKSETYTLGPKSGDWTRRLLIEQEFDTDMAGYEIYASIEMDGVGIVIRDTTLHYTVLG